MGLFLILLGGLVVICFFMFFVFLMDGIANKNKKDLFLSFCFLIATGILIYLIYGFYHKDLEDLRYQTNQKSILCKVKVTDIYKEKEQEAKYKISVNGISDVFSDNIIIPESIYNQYIGDENNVITIKKSSICLYIGTTFPLGIETNFNTDWEWLDYIGEYKYSYPWEADVSPYTVEDAKNLAISYLEGDIEPTGEYGGTDISDELLRIE